MLSMLTSKPTDPVGCDYGVLAARIRQGDPAGVEELHRFLSRGVRFLVDRKVPASQADGCVQVVFDRVIGGLRSGALGESAWLVEYVHAHLETHIREIQGRRPPMEKGPSPTGQPPVTEEHRRIGEDLLRDLAPGERQSLERFYAGGDDDRQTRRELGMPAAEFRALRARVRGRFRKLCRHDPPAV